jgi:hypothetical protein
MLGYLHHIESHSYQVTISIRTIELWVMMTPHIFGYGIITQTTNHSNQSKQQQQQQKGSSIDDHHIKPNQQY